jgi:TDG/mug DNA glycosylase family protein
MPGAQSITEQKYYANPRNQFWKIIYAVLSTPFEQCYESRLEFIQNKGIALWDVIDKCRRIGSLDSNIEKASVNDFESLYSNYPNLKLVVFNGAKAHELYKKQVGFNRSDLNYKLLPSTSPAACRSPGRPNSRREATADTFRTASAYVSWRFPIL